MYLLGINIGSVSVKFVYLNNNNILFSKLVPHEGNIEKVVKNIFDTNKFNPETKVLVSGNEGRYLFEFNKSPEVNCIENYIKKSDKNIRAAVSMGGEDIVVYICDENKNIYDSISGSKCATGTGEFFKQQLGRMDMKLSCLQDDSLFENSKAQSLSKRCSVFMKSDCTHRLNKGQATKADIVLSLSNVIANKISDYLQKANIPNSSVILYGGLSQNKYIVNYLKEYNPQLSFIIPENAQILDAHATALLAETKGSKLSDFSSALKKESDKFKTYSAFKDFKNKINYIDFNAGKIDINADYALGIDGGSTTTKLCLVNIETKEIVAHYYNRTHGNPVASLKKCLEEIIKQLKENSVKIEDLKLKLISTTGSSRELLGIFTQTNAVYNEILAHGKGTSFYCSDADTIFEIGGQDAKYISLQNGVAIDYAMNEACSAGTGSFLEEAASGDLNISDVNEIGKIAEKSNAPIKFSEHCSAFINAEIRKAAAQAYSKEDITAGLVVSIVSNYLNRVAGNRKIGNNISLQGGVAKNSAVPLAFAMLLKKNINIPPMPELLGCFGTALIAIEKNNDYQKNNNYNLNSILNTEFNIEKHITCKACENLCEIAVVNINGNKKMFGGRCSKYTISNKSYSETNGNNYIADYRKRLFDTYKQDEHNNLKNNKKSIGIPMCFSVYNLFPLFYTFFSELDYNIILSDKVNEKGFAKLESDYCYPAEIAHGAVYDIAEKNTDYIFLPHFKEKFDNNDSTNHSCTCPITQALPYYIKKAFPNIDNKVVSTVISYKSNNNNELINSFVETGIKLGKSKAEAKNAIINAIKSQEKFDNEIINWGNDTIKHVNKSDKPTIMLMGRPYNAFTKDANMGIPDKFTSKGFDVIPFNIVAGGEKDIYDNMYWYYGRQVLEAVNIAVNNKNIYPVYITNFSCAPDSFILHYISWLMKSKPFLVLELDSHTADAGIDTRIEAFLDIIDNHHNTELVDTSEEASYDNSLEFIVSKKEDIHIRNNKTNEKIKVRGNPKVKMLLSNMGRYSTELVSKFVKSYGINAEALPLADEFTVQTAKALCSGKECLPSHLVLGSFLQFVSSDKYKKDEIYMLFVPTTTGPCRTGQYYVFYNKLIRDLQLENVLVVTLDSDNSYNEFGSGFSKKVWWSLTIADYLKDIENNLRVCAKDKNAALEVFENNWNKLLKESEKSTDNIISQLKNFANNLAEIPLKTKPESLKKVLFVGEIYVRRDDFAVEELINYFADNNIVCKISGITEWIYYCDYVRKTELFPNKYKTINKSNIFNRDYKGQIVWKIENTYKRQVERKIKNALKPSNLLIDFPHDMDLIMKNCKDNFIDNDLYSEISISGGMAFTSLNNSFAGVVNISPFACLIGRVIEGIVKPWARNEKKPLISVEIDGNPIPINTYNKIDTFISALSSN